ncbi:MAG: sigma-70 family RNA polymerase sigma factor [Acidimicrobiales bacterium]
MALAPTDVARIEETTAMRLVTAHRCGDPDAFAEIVHKHYPSLLSTAHHRLRNAEDAQDAVQETLLRALLALDRFGYTGDWRLGAWLHTILVNVCTDIPSRRTPTTPLNDAMLETRADEDEPAASDPVALAAVKRAIEELPESQRLAFELRLVDGRPYDEVAGALGITEVNARARVRRARAKLQHALQGTNAVKGAWAAIPLLLATPLRTALRRVFAGVGNAAGAAGSQSAVTGMASTAGSSAAGAIAGTPVETGLQLIAQVSATPLGQAAVASVTSVPAKGPVVLGIALSLATAGGLSAPAISGSTAAPKPAAQAVHAAVPTSHFRSVTAPLQSAEGTRTASTFAPRVSGTFAVSTSSAPATSSSTATTPASTPGTPTAAVTSSSSSSTTAGPAGSTSGTPSVASAPNPTSTTRATVPTWYSTAALAAVYRITTGTSPGVTSTSETGSAGSGTGTTTGSSSPAATTSASGPGSPSPATTSSSAPGTASSSTTSVATITVKQGSGAGGAPTTSTSTPTSSTPGGSSQVPLPVGTCAAVPGFPGVAAPASEVPLVSDVQTSVLSTGPQGLTSAGATSPAFEGTALVTPISTGSSSTVHAQVGTCLGQGGSILAVDITSTTGAQFQLVGSLVARPSITSTGGDVYLFRGSVTQLAGPTGPGGRLSWDLPSEFVAEVQVQQPARTASLTVVFDQPKGAFRISPVTLVISTTQAGSGAGSTSSDAGSTSSDAGSTSSGAGSTSSGNSLS